MKTIRLLLGVIGIISLFSVLVFNSCSGRRDSDDPPRTGNVGVSFTADSSEFKHVVATIEEIKILNTDTGAVCDVAGAPITTDLTDLVNVTQLANIAGCPEGAYNRIQIELDKSVTVTSALTGTTATLFSACSLASYKDQENAVHPLECSGPLCSLTLNGAVNVLASGDARLTIDFNLEDFEAANPGDPSAGAAAIKASPLGRSDLKALGYPEAIVGLVSEVTPADRTFNLARGDLALTVDYSQIPAERQPGLDALLRFAWDNALRVKVVSPKIGMGRETVVASDVFVKIEGVSPDLNTLVSPLMLTFGSDTAAMTIPVDFNKADLSGMPADNGWVIVRLYGNDGTNYLASRIIVEPSGLSSDG